MADWSFLTNHARALVCIAHDPGVRLRDIAATLDITERRAFGIVTDLAAAGYVVKDKDGRRNRYQVQTHLPLTRSHGPEQTTGEVLDAPSLTPAPTNRPICSPKYPGPDDTTPASMEGRQPQGPRRRTFPAEGLRGCIHGVSHTGVDA